MKITLVLLAITLSLFLAPIFSSNVSAIGRCVEDNYVFNSETQECVLIGSDCTITRTSFFGIPAWYKYLRSGYDASGECSPILSGGDTQTQVNSTLPIGLAILEAMIRLAGIGAVAMIFVAGFRFITSDGNPENAVAARKTAINAVIGLVIVVMSVNLVSFIGNNVFK